MQHDSVIWKVISPGNGGFCSFRRTMPNCPTKFCKNAYNVLGICHPLACPLANSRYATIREHKGQCYLLIKTIERAHSPSKHWEKIKLSKDYITALKQIDEYLMWWPKWNIHKCKLRLTKMHQYLIRARKIALSVQPKMLRIWKPYERQQVKRERKAEMAAKITNVIKSELLERLHEGVYEGIYNFPMKQYNEILDDKGKMDQSETESESETENEKSKNKKEKQKSKKDKNKQEKGKEKEKEKEISKEIENEKGDMFVADYGDDSDFEFVESGEESDYDIEDLSDEKEKEMELEYEYEMENGFNGQAPSNINDMNNMGQSIKSIAPSVKKNDQNNKNNKNNNKKNRSKSRNRKNNNDNNSSRNNKNSNNNDNGNGNWMNKQNNNRSRKQQWSRNNNSNNNNNTSILGKRGNGKFRNNNNNNKSNKGKGNNNNFDDFGMGSAMKAPPKKRQRKVKIGYD